MIATDDWITNYLKNFNTSARKMLSEITATFKKTALSIIKDNYGVHLPIAQCNNYGAVCEVKADDVERWWSAQGRCSL